MKLRSAILIALAASHAYSQIVVTATRLSKVPLLGPDLSWGSNGRFNPAAIRFGKKIVLLFRAVDASGTSRIGYAESIDGGRHFTARRDPILSPEAPYEKDGGVEDPRVVKIGKTFYMTYTGYNRHDAQLCLASSSDLIHWDRKGVIMPANQGAWNIQWTKSGAIVPVRIAGKYWMYYMGNQRDTDGLARDHMGIASSLDLLHWDDATQKPVLDRRAGVFDSRVMEPGPSPIFTKAGLLLLYNGADDNLVYGPGWLLFDAQDPTKLIARSDKPFALPELPWEKKGSVPNVVFLEGAIPRSAKGRSLELTGYYGAADRNIGSMNLHISLGR